MTEQISRAAGNGLGLDRRLNHRLDAKTASDKPILTPGQATVRDRLAQARVRANLSQPELAKLTGLSLSTVRSYELGYRKVTRNTLVTVCRALELPDLHNLEEILVQGVKLDRGVPSKEIELGPHELSWVRSANFPAALMIPGLLWVPAVNEAYERLHPGIHPGSSFLAWLLLDARAKTVLGEDWWPETHLGVWTAMRLRRRLTSSADQNALRRMSRAPEFETMATKPPGRFYAARTIRQLSDLAGQRRPYYVNVHRDAVPLPRSGDPALPTLFYHSLIPA